MRPQAPFHTGDFLLASNKLSQTKSLTNYGYECIAKSPTHHLYVKYGNSIRLKTQGDRCIVIFGSIFESSEKALDSLLNIEGKEIDHVCKKISKIIELIKGHFAICFYCQQAFYVATDHLATQSLYHANISSECEYVIGTNFLNIIKFTNVTLDPVSVYELINKGVITTPHTLIKECHRILPGYIRAISSCEPFDHRYWFPPIPIAGGLEERASGFLIALKQLFIDLSGESDTVSMMYSGGEDSRILANIAKRMGINVNAIIF